MIEKICLIFSVILLMVLFATLILSSSENNYHYCYIDENNNLGVSARCRNNYCENYNSSEVVVTKDYIDLRIK